MSDNTEKMRGSRAAVDKHVLKVGISSGHRGRVKNQRLTWAELREKLSTPSVDSITKAQYDKLPVTEQVKLKNKGYFTSSQFEKGKRNIKSIVPFKSLIAWDIDKPTVEQFAELINPDPDFSALTPYEHFVYTTRSHNKAHPRARVVIPLYKEVDLDTADAVSRILAEKFDAKMVAVDPVSYRPAQIMYMPSISADQRSDFITHHNQGRLLDAHADVLDLWDRDWKNPELLPRGEREEAPRESMIGKVQHPTEKRGWVGAFCRTISVIDGLFMLSEFYEPAEDGPDPTRWSYIKGTSRGGVLAYSEDDRFYSNHSSDPCYMQNLTIFDGFRIHLFGHLDDDSDGETDVTKSKSYLAMIEHIKTDPEFEAVRHAYAAENYDVDAMADDAEFEAELEDEPKTPAVEVSAAAEPEVDLLKLLDFTESGQVRKTIHNIALILEHDKRFKGAFRFNEMTRRVVVTRRISAKRLNLRTPDIDAESGDPMTDNIRTTVRRIMSAPNRKDKEGKTLAGWGLQVGDDDLAKAIDEVAHARGFHPVRQFLQGLEWDGVSRLRSMLHTYWHIPLDNTGYHAEVAEKTLVAAVARVFEPGHKFDYMVIFEGLTGYGKSTACKLLAVRPEWFTEFTADLDKNERVIENVVGKWIIEWPELSSMTKAESESVKALLSSSGRTGRLAFRREQEDFKLQGVFFGTTNEDEYLRDKTGNRRYWPVKITAGRMIDTEGLRRDMPQIWAEVYQVYLWYRRQFPKSDYPDLPLFLTGDAKTAAEFLQQQRMVKGIEEIWEGQIYEWLEKPVSEHELQTELESSVDDDLDDSADNSKKLLRQRVCIAQVATSCLGLEMRRVSRIERDIISRILAVAPGWTTAPNPLRFGKYGRQKGWVRKVL